MTMLLSGPFGVSLSVLSVLLCTGFLITEDSPSRARLALQRGGMALSLLALALIAWRFIYMAH
jgi:hypothetical protein